MAAFEVQSNSGFDPFRTVEKNNTNMTSRNFLRRFVQLISVASSAGSCVVAGTFGYEVARASPAALGTGVGDKVFTLTAMALEWMPRLPKLGGALALTVVLVFVAGFVFSKSEDTRLQVTLWATSFGFVAAVQIWALIGIGLVMLPNASSGI